MIHNVVIMDIVEKAVFNPDKIVIERVQVEYADSDPSSLNSMSLILYPATFTNLIPYQPL